MNIIFHNLIGQCIEVYIDDVVVKSADFNKHLANLEQAFLKMKKHSLNMNMAKSAFGVLSGSFFGFLVHKKELRWIRIKPKQC